MDEVSEKYSEKLKRVAAKYTLVLEKAMEGSMSSGQFSLISNQVAVLGKLAGITSEKVEHKHQIEGGFNINIQKPKKKIELIEAEDITQLLEIEVTDESKILIHHNGNLGTVKPNGYGRSSRETPNLRRF